MSASAVTPLCRLPENPLVRPEQIRYCRATGTFNAGATVCHRTGRVVLLVRVYEGDTGRSSLALATSEDGVVFDEILDRPAVAREAPYEELGVEDCRITFLEDEGRYAITYTGYSAAGPRVCLITTDDILAPARYVRHGPRLPGDNKNGVVFPRRVGGVHVVLHRPMRPGMLDLQRPSADGPAIVMGTVRRLEGPWPEDGARLLGPEPGTWRSSRVGAGAPPLETELGWLLAFHGATTVPEGNVYAMGFCLLDRDDPSRVRYVSPSPALRPEAPYERHPGPLPQVDMANFPHGVQVVFPEGLVTRGDDLIVYYGAADWVVAGARASRLALVASLAAELARAGGAAPA